MDDIHSKFGERDGDLEQALKEKEEELEIYKSGMDQTLLELNELRMVSIHLKTMGCSLANGFRTVAIRTKRWTTRLTKCF